MWTKADIGDHSSGEDEIGLKKFTMNSWLTGVLSGGILRFRSNRGKRNDVGNTRAWIRKQKAMEEIQKRQSRLKSFGNAKRRQQERDSRKREAS